MKRIIVAGSRNFDNYYQLERVLDKTLPSDTTNIEIVSGHARGADSLGEEYAKNHNIKCKVFIPKWKELGPAAGPIRNKEMLDYALKEEAILVAFWDGITKGTNHMINISKEAKIKIFIYNYITNELKEI